MNNNLKFRAFDVKSKEMINPIDFIEIDSEGKLFRDDKILMQFTGLIDKNGKEIYEGDILGGINYGDFIKYCDKCKSFEVFYTNDYCYSCEHEFFWCDIVDEFVKKNLQVIGNIYQNTELLLNNTF